MKTIKLFDRHAALWANSLIYLFHKMFDVACAFVEEDVMLASLVVFFVEN
jgi:hypothetical protein